jgi:UDP-N-acetylmuramoylalanine--D-glutamate ligase
VTGTKGKTTTTALIGAIFRAAGGKTTYVGGNIGNALIARRRAPQPDDWVVAEVSRSSSSRSARSSRASRCISTSRPITSTAITRWTSTPKRSSASSPIKVRATRSSATSTIRSSGAGEDEGERASRRALWFAREPHRSTTLYVRNETIVYAPPTGDPRPVEIMPVDEIPLLGAHNVENVMAAILVGSRPGSTARRSAAVRAFEPLGTGSKRRRTRRRAYVDDSKATNPGAVIAALRSFDRPIVLIAGGKSKGTDFAEMGKVISSRAKGGRADRRSGRRDRRHVKRATVDARRRRWTRRSRRAPRVRRAGDVVLLSPGCASFDMFARPSTAATRSSRAVRALGRCAR